MVSSHLHRHHLSSPTLAGLVASFASNIAAYVLPQETKTIQQQPLSIVSWPVLATSPPEAPNGLFPRQPNTICGFIGGDPNLPATCLAGSHCVVAVDNGAIGCCPDNGYCKGGIFTGCVDQNSGPQTVADPYIFTCQGRDVCYKNMFEGGFFQYGCGSTSGLATTVQETASGKDPVRLTSISVALTATATPLVQPLKASVESTSKAGTSSAGLGPAVVTAGSQPSSSHGDTAPSSEGSSSVNTGAIVGGTIGGVAFLAAFILLAVFLWRRRSRNGRADVQRPKNMGSLAHSPSQFEPLAPRREVMQASAAAKVTPGRHDRGRESMESGVFGNTLRPSLHPDEIGRATTRDGVGRGESDSAPLTGEFDGHSHGFHLPMEGMENDDDYDHGPVRYPGPRRGGGGGALWQQNRRRNRNLAWM